MFAQFFLFQSSANKGAAILIKSRVYLKLIEYIVKIIVGKGIFKSNTTTTTKNHNDTKTFKSIKKYIAGAIFCENSTPSYVIPIYQK